MSGSEEHARPQPADRQPADPLAAPLPTTLDKALALVEAHLGIDAMLADSGEDRVAPYYEQSRIGYERLHSHKGCMHMALNPDGRFHPSGFLAQPNAAVRHARQLGARRVLELGCGLGFNARRIATALPEAEVIGTDLLEAHVRDAREASTDLPNLSFRQASFDDLPDDLGQFDLIVAVETLCYARVPATTAAAIARRLRPGGRLLIFDGFRRARFSEAPEAMRTATALYEIGMAVTHGFSTLAAWKRALTGQGLTILNAADITGNAMPGVLALQNRALGLLDGWSTRLMLRAAPRYLARNAASALLGPHVCAGPGPQGSLSEGTVVYARLVAQAPQRA